MNHVRRSIALTVTSAIAVTALAATLAVGDGDAGGRRERSRA